MDAMDPRGPVSMCLRDARAYATRIDAACTEVALCLSTASEGLVSLTCPRIMKALRPASSWICAAGVIPCDESFASPLD